MPAFIDYIFKYTKKEKIVLYGHSQGSTTALAMLAERPEYNNKISSIHLLAPTVVAKEHHLPMQWFIKNVKQIAVILTHSGDMFSSLPRIIMIVVFLFEILFLKELAEENDLFEVFANVDFAESMKSLGKVCADPTWNVICKSFVELLGGPFSQNSFSRVNN